MIPSQTRSRAGEFLGALVLAAVISGCASADYGRADASKQLRGARDSESVSVRMGETVFMRYRYDNVPFKPYVEQLRSPAGVNVLRDSPFDHKHHHALMFAVGVDGVNFWEELPACGKEVHRPRADRNWSSWTNGQGRETYIEYLDWIAPQAPKPLLHECRTIEVHAAKDIRATLLTWQSQFTLPEGKTSAKITGAEYFGLGMRFPQSMDSGGVFCNADGKSGVTDTNAHRSTWCSYAASVDGKAVTVAMFDHPTNFRHPATWFTMEKPFAYLCATLNLKSEPIELAPGKPLTLRYGVAVWDGTARAAEIEKLYRRWTALPAPALPKW